MTTPFMRTDLGLVAAQLWLSNIDLRDVALSQALDRYPLPRVEQIVEVSYLYCNPGPEGKLIQAKYFGKARDDVALRDRFSRRAPPQPLR